MERKASMDALGAAALIGFALLLAFNQVVIKVSNGGFNPVFQAGLRSAGAVCVLLIWCRWKGISVGLDRSALWAGMLSGVIFALEFVCLFMALDLTTVSRVSIIFYSMPVWLALVGHFVLPGEVLSGPRMLGLVLAMAGVALAMADRSGGQASLVGDVLALGAALGWTAIVLFLRIGPLSKVRPEVQLFWQVAVSTFVLIGLAPLFGPLVREVQAVHLAGLAFQIVAVASLGFLFWFWLMTIYPAASVASFSFLSPVFSVVLGWLILSEHVGWQVWVALIMVAGGIFLINRRYGVS